MASGVLDRLLRLVVPKPDPSFMPAPRPLGPGLWLVERRVFLAGARLPSTLRQVMQWPFERIVVAHGAADVFVSAFAKYVT